ncbi:Conserved_hypothetical protein [Hexamita inflata]|uniref:Uncharacterized protein n=1 Tax=Hexamita inflata TaxID=28002 RepID=A0AA86QWL7_9EUKA|nr:Conserved hypothetical protein [Hexamita inflata]
MEIDIQNGIDKQLQGKQTVPNKFVKTMISIQQFLQPASYSEQGSSRIISIDVLRGIAIFCTCFIHEVSLFLDVNIILKLKMPEALLGYIIGIPSMLFSQWKTLFTIICGMTYAYQGVTFDTALRLFLAVFGRLPNTASNCNVAVLRPHFWFSWPFLSYFVLFLENSNQNFQYKKFQNSYILLRCCIQSHKNIIF